MGLETILAVWGGLYLDNEIISEADLQPYIDDTLNELEFLLVFWSNSLSNLPLTCARGRLRRHTGHCEPHLDTRTLSP
jgi:hypothetical protein